MQLAPDDEGMEQAHKDYLSKVESRIAGAKISQLAMAAPLESVNSASKPKASTPSAQKPAEVKEKSNQKVGIVSALLSIGSIRPALSLITMYPWMVDANPQLADLIIRIMKHSIASLYESALVVKERPTGFMQSKARYGASGVQPAPARKPHLTFWAPTPPSTSVWDFVFFFPKWTERVPVCTQLSDLVDFVEPFMRFLTVHISRDPLFVTKFLRLGRHHLATTVSSPGTNVILQPVMSIPTLENVNITGTDGSRDEEAHWTPRPRKPYPPVLVEGSPTSYASCALPNSRERGLHRGSLEYDQAIRYNSSVEALRRMEDECLQVPPRAPRTGRSSRPRSKGYPPTVISQHHRQSRRTGCQACPFKPVHLLWKRSEPNHGLRQPCWRGHPSFEVLDQHEFRRARLRDFGCVGQSG